MFDTSLFDSVPSLAGGQMPLPSQVRNGVTYGTDDAVQTGTLVVPAPNKVKAGNGYGAGGTEFVGTFNIVVPAPSQVLAGVNFGDAQIGTYLAPDESDVQYGLRFGPAQSLRGSYTGESQALTIEAFLDGLSRQIPLSAPKGSFAEALLAARASVFGSRTRVAGSISYFAPDGTTVLKVLATNADGSIVTEAQA